MVVTQDEQSRPSGCVIVNVIEKQFLTRTKSMHKNILCFSSSVIFLLVDACVGLNWLLVSFYRASAYCC